MAMLFVIARGFGYTSLLESWIATTFEAQPVVAQTIVNFVHNYIENTKGDYIIGTGIVMFLYTIISLMQKIELTFDGIWRPSYRCSSFSCISIMCCRILTSSSSVRFCRLGWRASA